MVPVHVTKAPVHVPKVLVHVLKVRGNVLKASGSVEEDLGFNLIGMSGSPVSRQSYFARPAPIAFSQP